MKKLMLPDVKFTAQSADGTIRVVSAAEQLYLLVSLPSDPRQPFSLDDIRQRLPVADKLDTLRKNGSRVLKLEDAQYDVLVKAVKASTWTGVSKDALALCDAVLNDAETIDIEAKPNRAQRRRKAKSD